MTTEQLQKNLAAIHPKLRLFEIDGQYRFAFYSTPTTLSTHALTFLFMVGDPRSKRLDGGDLPSQSGITDDGDGNLIGTIRYGAVNDGFDLESEIASLGKEMAAKRVEHDATL